jgi:hypothetical protein
MVLPQVARPDRIATFRRSALCAILSGYLNRASAGRSSAAGGQCRRYDDIAVDDDTHSGRLLCHDPALSSRLGNGLVGNRQSLLFR